MSSLENKGKRVWRSLAELEEPASSDKMRANEFAEGASLPLDKPSRRQFLIYMAAGAGLAGMAGCRWPKENILPYAHRPAEIVPGNPLYFATSMDVAGRAQGLVVTSYDGRPIKVDGNERHPNSRGGSDAQGQASILDLYDPDRSKTPVQLVDRRYLDQRWEDYDGFAREHFERLRQSHGAGLYVLSETSSSASVQDMRGRFAKAYPQAKWYEYEPISWDQERAGAKLAFGRNVRTQYRFDRAAVVVSLDDDFLASRPACLSYAREFMGAHTPTPDNPAMSRLYVAESTYTNTGAMADARLSVPAGDIWQVAVEIATELGGPALPGEIVELIRRQVRTQARSAFAKAAAKDLMAQRGKGIVLAGKGQPAEVHALAHVLNFALGNVGQTVWYSEDPDGDRQSHLEAIGELVGAMRGGQVETLLILGGNPVYDAPAELEFGAAMGKVATSIHVGLHWDETSQRCSWHVPRAHYLEAWGDTRAYDGTYAPAQPLIHPLYDGRSVIEVLSQISETPARSGYEIVQETAKSFLKGTDFEAGWRALLNDGVLANTTFEPQQPQLQTGAIAEAIGKVPSRAALGPENLEIVFREDAKVYDGRFANNGWLQELPEVFTKITWDNAVLMAPETAAKLGIKDSQIVTIRRAGREIVGPVYIMPGQAALSVTVSLGYGRKAAGKVGNEVGFDAYALRTSSAMHFGDGATVQSTGRVHAFATTQEHWNIDKIGREGTRERLGELVREMTLAELGKAAEAPQETKAPEQLWPPFEYNGYKWGMAIDMQKCIGCNACTVACQAENNSVTVGPEQVRRHREMHWLRIDRYFRGEAADAAVSFQPMFCVHCENAPCESVCPVAATLHDQDGLNLMVYNRCVGTRYCSNNCPYKVRRFNFYHFSLGLPPVRQMQMNPNVTVRSRGVMEKCTYCVQRIQRAKITAKNERRGIRDGEFTTACAQACPTGAIVFGDLNDPKSRVTQLHRDRRAYAMLLELNTRPRTVHLARVRNAGR